MHDFFDYRTIAVAFALKSFLQALALIYVWHVDRRYPPARKWAIGSLILAAGTLLIAPDVDHLTTAIMVARVLLIYTGLYIFGIGIMEACVKRVRWRLFAGFWAVACLMQLWFSVYAPSITGRVGVFSFSVACGAGVVAFCGLCAPKGPLQGTRRLIGVLVAIQAVVAFFQGITAVDAQFFGGLRSVGLQVAFLFVSI